MSDRSSRSVLKSIVGWLIVALVAFWLLDLVVGTVRVLARFVVWIVIIGLLVVAYFKLSKTTRSSDEDGAPDRRGGMWSKFGPSHFVSRR